jgi:hypothetical protein
MNRSSAAISNLLEPTIWDTRVVGSGARDMGHDEVAGVRLGLGVTRCVGKSVRMRATEGAGRQTSVHPAVNAALNDRGYCNGIG